MFRKNFDKSDTYISDSIIHHPKINHNYRIKQGASDLVITFEGDGIKNCEYFDISTGSFRMYSNPSPYQARYDDRFFISEKVIPGNGKSTTLTPLFYNSTSLNFQRIHDIEIVLNESKLGISLNMNSNVSHFKAFYPENMSILARVKKFIPDMEVTMGKYPVFLTKNRPKTEFLESLYMKFMRYNNPSKLVYQYKNQLNKCSIRAHFVNRMLEGYGIQSFKIFKVWNSPKEAWKKFPGKEAWYYHCAAMIIDQENNIWVWDPWVGHNKKLLTPMEWMYRSDEPHPSAVYITSSFNIIKWGETGKMFETHYPHFMTDADKGDISTLQAAFSSAIPNPPKIPLPGVVYMELGALSSVGLFVRKKRKDSKLLLEYKENRHANPGQ